VDEYVTVVKDLSGGKDVELVGYSGGAWVALQVAARLENVTRVRTVAGNLAPNWINDHHHVSAMDVADYPAGRLAVLPVLHYFGGADTVVVPGVADAYTRQTAALCARTVTVAGATHNDGWVERWPQLLAEKPGCV
jgi:pimeloyl-ACP methyl ester carboxylesterase